MNPVRYRFKTGQLWTQSAFVILALGFGVFAVIGSDVHADQMAVALWRASCAVFSASFILLTVRVSKRGCNSVQRRSLSSGLSKLTRLIF